mmetsp:Transcript_27286/g.56107  ORF Transcript_27286/g.56107 Transcript_27286/m.56107 type:complete len:257 (+) Transcript_27286:1819-2589(+)
MSGGTSGSISVTSGISSPSMLACCSVSSSSIAIPSSSATTRLTSSFTSVESSRYNPKEKPTSNSLSLSFISEIRRARKSFTNFSALIVQSLTSLRIAEPLWKSRLPSKRSKLIRWLSRNEAIALTLHSRAFCISFHARLLSDLNLCCAASASVSYVTMACWLTLVATSKLSVAFNSFALASSRFRFAMANLCSGFSTFAMTSSPPPGIIENIFPIALFIEGVILFPAASFEAPGIMANILPSDLFTEAATFVSSTG